MAEIFLKLMGIFVFIALLLIPKRSKAKRKISNEEIAADHSSYGVTIDGEISLMSCEKGRDD